MTITKNRKETKLNGRTYFVEQYAEKPNFVWYWRYGYMLEDRVNVGHILKSQLRSRPNLKRLFN